MEKAQKYTGRISGDRNQCPSCRCLFNSSFAFEKHRIGEHGISRRCLTPDEMLATSTPMFLPADNFWRGKRRTEGTIYSE